MKKIKCIIAFALSLSLCTAMAGCGKDKAESSSSSVAAETKADSVNDESSEDSEEETEAEETEAAKETSEEESDEFAYYNDLAEEYKNNSVSGPFGYGLIIKTLDGKSCTINYADEGFYNMETKKFIPGSFDYCDGKNLYSFDEYDNATIKKYDLDGNEIQSVNDVGGRLSHIITPNQEIIYYTGEALKMVSADFKEKTDLPMPIATEGSHGLTVEMEQIGLIGFYNDKLVAFGSNNNEYYLCMMDMNSHEWNCSPSDYYVASSPSSNVRIVGKYVLASRGLFNLETGETISSGDFSEYAGGTFSVSGYYREIGQYPKDYEYDEYKQEYNFSGTGEYIDDGYPISDTQFLYVDDYGAFIRNFDDPETDVETVYLAQQ